VSVSKGTACGREETGALLAMFILFLFFNRISEMRKKGQEKNVS